MTAPTQRERVLAALRARRSEGILATEFLPPAACDGGAPILRLPSRITELRQAGFTITSTRMPSGVARYTLVDEPDRPAAATPLEAYMRHRAEVDADGSGAAAERDATPRLFDEIDEPQGDR